MKFDRKKSCYSYKIFSYHYIFDFLTPGYELLSCCFHIVIGYEKHIIVFLLLFLIAWWCQLTEIFITCPLCGVFKDSSTFPTANPVHEMTGIYFSLKNRRKVRWRDRQVGFTEHQTDR